MKTNIHTHMAFWHWGSLDHGQFLLLSSQNTVINNGKCFSCYLFGALFPCDIRKYSIVKFINIKMDSLRLCDLLNFQLTRLLVIQSTDGVFLNWLCWFTALKWLLEKRTTNLIRSRPTHTQQTWAIFYQLQKKKNSSFYTKLPKYWHVLHVYYIFQATGIGMLLANELCQTYKQGYWICLEYSAPG